MIVTIHSATYKPDQNNTFIDEVNATMCMCEAFFYINKIPYSFTNPKLIEGEIRAKLIIRHNKFSEIDFPDTQYFVQMVQFNIASMMRLSLEER